MMKASYDKTVIRPPPKNLSFFGVTFQWKGFLVTNHRWFRSSERFQGKDMYIPCF